MAQLFPQKHVTLLRVAEVELMGQIAMVSVVVVVVIVVVVFADSDKWECTQIMIRKKNQETSVEKRR